MIKREYKKVKLTSLLEYSRNNKIHANNVDEIVKSIQANTYISPIIINKEGLILAGHGRKLAMERLGMEEAEVLQITGLSKAQERDFRLRDNKLSELSEWSIENINFELEQLQIPELTALFDVPLEDIDFDDIKSNEDRENTKKVQNVICPNCSHPFTL